jgi:hypothetical protein
MQIVSAAGFFRRRMAPPPRKGSMYTACGGHEVNESLIDAVAVFSSGICYDRGLYNKAKHR